MSLTTESRLQWSSGESISKRLESPFSVDLFSITVRFETSQVAGVYILLLPFRQAIFHDWTMLFYTILFLGMNTLYASQRPGQFLLRVFPYLDSVR